MRIPTTISCAPESDFQGDLLVIENSEPRFPSSKSNERRRAIGEYLKQCAVTQPAASGDRSRRKSCGREYVEVVCCHYLIQSSTIWKSSTNLPHMCAQTHVGQPPSANWPQFSHQRRCSLLQEILVVVRRPNARNVALFLECARGSWRFRRTKVAKRLTRRRLRF